jgi:hypothetical protein
MLWVDQGHGCHPGSIAFVKGIMMDVVVVDVPTNYGMLLSRTWA